MVASTARSGDVIDSSEFEIDLQLRSKELLGYLLAMTLFYTAFTITFYVGIPIANVYESIGSSTETEMLVDKYNAYSSYVMALVEVLLGVYMDQFVPALNVFLHNSLFFLVRDAAGQPRSVRSRRLHATILILLPVIIALTNSSVKGLQAMQFTTGVKRVVALDDLKMDQSVLEKIKSKRVNRATRQRAVSETILKNAIRQRATPFTFQKNSSCKRNDSSGGNDYRLNPRDLAVTSAIYGFVPREWNSEALMIEPNKSSNYTVTYEEAINAVRTNRTLAEPANFSIRTAYEMLVQGKIVIERAFGNAVGDVYDCSLSDGRGNIVSASSPATIISNDTVEGLGDAITDQWMISVAGSRLCQGGISSMFQMSDYYSRDVFKVEDLIRDAAEIFGVTIPYIAKEETQIMLDTYDLTSQVRLETMQIDFILSTSVWYSLNEVGVCPGSDASCDSKYVYGKYQNTFCGSNNCAFADTSGAFPIQPEIGVLPYYVNCTLDMKRIHYSADLRAFFPDECKKASKTTFLYGYGSYMTGKAFSSNGSGFGSNDPDSESNASESGSSDSEVESSDPISEVPFILAPRRRISLTFAKVKWMSQDLATDYNATCDHDSTNHTSKANCTGLAYQLQRSGRYLFAGEDALPKKALGATSFRAPIPLVRLNLPAVWYSIERLAPENFGEIMWPRLPKYSYSALGGSKCSLLMDSYLKYVSENNLFLERPMQVMYTSFFYFLMQNAAVTQLNDTLLALRGVSTQETVANDRLGNVRLKGDFQLRSIRVSIPWASYATTLVGCVCIFIGTVVIILVPVRCVKFFPKGTTKAERFMTMRYEKHYPSSVHDKLLELPASGASVRFDDLTIEALTLQTMTLKPVSPIDSKASKEKHSAEEATISERTHDSESDGSHSTMSEEIP